MARLALRRRPGHPASARQLGAAPAAVGQVFIAACDMSIDRLRQGLIYFQSDCSFDICLIVRALYFLLRTLSPQQPQISLSLVETIDV